MLQRGCMKAGRTFRRPKHLLYITAVSNNTRPAMSKMSSDFGFFCDVRYDYHKKTNESSFEHVVTVIVLEP